MSRVSMREMPARLFLCMVPSDIDCWLKDNGYSLVPRTRPGVNGRGAVNVRLVWRGPDRTSMVLTFRLRGSIPDDLLDALADAMTPTVPVHA